MTRRSFLKLTASAAAAAAMSQAKAASPAQPILPRRRGFNLPELAGGHKNPPPYQESDFEMMATWGFTFARLPCSYWTWSDKENWMVIDEKAVEPVDRAIALGKQYGIHCNLNLHRIPGYCVNGRELEPYLMFDSPRDSMERCLEAARHHWSFLAHRYRDVPSEQLSFDLMNEPPFMKDQSRYVEICKDLIAAIRRENPNRLIMADGADIGQTPVLGLIDQGIVQSTRGYQPKMVSHYTATWVPDREFESHARPTWPMKDDHGVLWDRAKLKEVLIDSWQPLVKAGVPIHVGEWGCYNKTPHAACLGWFSDMLDLWKQAGWGWSMWNLRGDFGIMDSGRADVAYEDYKGHKLDRKMLELLLAH